MAAAQDDDALQSLLHARPSWPNCSAASTRSALGIDRPRGGGLAFIFRRLVEAGYTRDEGKLADAIRLLEIDAKRGIRCASGRSPRRGSIRPTTFLPPREERPWPQS